MEFRRSGQSDERRRRVLRDEKHASPDENEETSPSRTRKSGGAAASPGKSYSDAALDERQPRIVDLLPTRLYGLAVLWLSALTGLAALVVAYVYLPELTRFASRTDLDSFNLAGPNSLAAWCSSSLFLLAAGGCVLIFSLRRHKVDDYRGHYLVWLPAACAMLFLSVDATTSVHRVAVGILARCSGVTGFGNGVIWSVALFGLLFLTLGLRLAFEMRRSRLAIAALAMAVACYGLSVPFCLEVWHSGNVALGVLAKSILLILGHISISTTVGLYARHVYLDAQGRLVPRKSKAKKVKKTKDETAEGGKKESDVAELAKSAGKSRRIDAAHTEAPAPKPAQSASPAGSSSSPSRAASPLASRVTAAAGGSASKFGDATQVKAAATISRQSAVDEDDDDEDDDGDDEGSRLSKAERKRMKKMQRRGRPVGA